MFPDEILKRSIRYTLYNVSSVRIVQSKFSLLVYQSNESSYCASVGIYETCVRLSYFGTFVNTQINVRQFYCKSDIFRLYSKVLSATPLHSFCGLVHISEEFFPTHDVRLVAVSDGVDSDEGENEFTPFKNLV